jgi:citrate synthase
VAYLLIYGELPTEPELDTSRSRSAATRCCTRTSSASTARCPRTPTRWRPARRGGALSTFYQDSLDPRDPRQVEISVHRLLAKLPTIAAYAYKHSIGQPFMYPDNKLRYVGNFLRMMFATPCEDYEVDPVIEKALDLLFILHADHEQNCSTSTVRLVGSSMVNLFAAVSAGINALWGPLHGGANQAVIEMLEKIRDEGIDGAAVRGTRQEQATTPRA